MVRHVVLAAYFPTHPDRLYDAYLDREAHAAITGQAVTIAAHRGAGFSAFGGILSGSILHLEPKRLIVQTWRSASWPPDAMDSVLTLSFHADGAGARIELAHVHIPESDYTGICHGWENRYWAPWRAYLSAASGAIDAPSSKTR